MSNKAAPQKPTNAADDGTVSQYLNGEYAEKNPTWHAEDGPWKAGQLERLLGSRRFSSILDYGAGMGTVLDNLEPILEEGGVRHKYDLQYGWLDVSGSPCEPLHAIWVARVLRCV